MSGSNDLVQVRRLVLLGETEKAFKVQERSSMLPVFIPKSLTDYIKRHPKDADGTQECDVKIPEWLAIEKDFSFD